MELNEFIKKVSYEKISDESLGGGLCYYSKIDGAYFTRLGMEEDGFRFLLKLGITEQLQNQDNISEHTVNIGFNPEEKKWYGWSHRAIFGFGVGSTCEKGNVHYRPTNSKEEMEDAILFWSDDRRKDVTAKKVTKGQIEVSWTDVKSGSISSCIHEYDPNNFGKGEWVAKTLDDAKQMAKDFAEGVS